VTDVRALTLQRPWGFAILRLAKDVENRSWSTRYRGPLLIHQGKTADPDAVYFPPLIAASDLVEQHDADRDAGGVVLGWVHLAGCHLERPGCCLSRWALPGVWHWTLDRPRPLAQPVTARGSQGLWAPSDDLLTAVRAAAHTPA
jgi:hypothetical protein